MNKPGVGHKFFFSGERSNLGQISQLYEKQKAEWAEAHPEATSREYEQAMRKIAEGLGY